MSAIENEMLSARRDFVECLRRTHKLDQELAASARNQVIQAPLPMESSPASMALVAPKADQKADGGKLRSVVAAEVDGAPSSRGGAIQLGWQEMQIQLRDLREINERVMAQNLSLLDDVEALQKQSSGLKQENAAMAS